MYAYKYELHASLICIIHHYVLFVFTILAHSRRIFSPFVFIFVFFILGILHVCTIITLNPQSQRTSYPLCLGTNSNDCTKKKAQDPVW